MKIPIIFLGTAQAIPTAKRNHTAILLNYKDENILIDCGEGTQRQFRKARISPYKLTRILITHIHGDHILGLPGLFQTLALNNYNKTLYIYGPRGIKKFISSIWSFFVFEGKLKIDVQEVNGKFFENPDFYLEAFPLSHRIPCNAYAFIEKDRRKLEKKKLKKFGLPSSSLLSELQKGKSIEHNGKIIHPEDVGYIEKGRKISFILDTELCANCYKVAENSSLLVTEATYSEKEKELALEHRHLTARQSAEIAKKSKSKQLILTHISQRYENKETCLINEAKKIFKNASIAEDLMRLEI